MKISEMITLLQKQLETRGDVEVLLHGHYGAAEETFEVIPNCNEGPGQLYDAGKLHIWTDITTG